ncbi:MAG: prepilin-type N-terminal cleavage/methylation domain-containing protein [Desulfamplus sp.]|nr:prepilin-type N-terminal cleavage/methylation domain-containing protein [Desulfamplus sp.]
MIYIGKKGFTLVELMVAMTISSIVGILMVSAYQVQVRSKNTQEELTDMNQTVRSAFETMNDEIRMAGLDPLSTANAGIMTATPGEISFSFDIKDNAGTNAPDGDVNDPGEIIRYRLTNDADNDGVNDDIKSGVECHLGRSESGGPLEPFALNVDAVNFVYLTDDNDGDGNPDVIPTPITTQSLRNSIRTVELTVVARAGTKSGPFNKKFKDKKAYRNKRGNVVLPVQGNNGNKFRRLMVTVSIQCRNMGI